MTEAKVLKARDLLLNETLVGFHADVDAARKVAATTSGKGYNRDRMIANSLPDLGMGAEKPAKD